MGIRMEEVHPMVMETNKFEYRDTWKLIALFEQSGFRQKKSVHLRLVFLM